MAGCAPSGAEGRLARAVRSVLVSGWDMSYVIFLVTGITGT